jgi:hypothetical protein
MKSLKLRFGDSKGEVIEYAKTFGVFQACDKYECGYIPMQKFLESETGDANCGINATLGSADHDITAEKLLDSFINKLNQLQAKNTQLESELEKLRYELNCRRAEQALMTEPKVLQVMQLIR